MKRGKRSSAAKATKAAQPVEEAPETSKIPMAVHISGLVKSWASEELTEKLKSISGSEIVDFRVNTSQSDVVVTLSDTEGAEKIRDAMNESTWDGAPNAKVLTVELVAPNFELPEPPAENSVTLDPVPAENALGEEEPAKETTEKRSDKQERGVLTTKTQPPLTFRPKSEEQIAQMRKRRNYELDSTILGGRYYGDRDRKRRHAELSSSNASSHAPSSSSGGRDSHSNSGGRHGGDRRYNDGGNRFGGSGRYERPNDRYDRYDRHDKYDRRDSGRF